MDMVTQKYPIGIQTFSTIRENGYVYVDKTSYIARLVEKGQYYFLSRPRRFGKSLLLSTLHSYFDGRRDLFKGLDLDSRDVDWTPSPVLHFDFNSGLYHLEDGLAQRLDQSLAVFEKIYGVDRTDGNAANRFENIIRAAYSKTGRKVVILVDEYDKPLLNLDEESDLFQQRQALLKGFFGNLKSMDRYIRFAFMTGVARFSKVSIFSDMNNLKDLSLTAEYADICGWTEEELVGNFQKGISRLAEEREESFNTTLEALRVFYDGYRFSGKGSRLYNPFSVLLALDNLEIEPYWYESGIPTFLAKRVKKFGITPASLNCVTRGRDSLKSVGIDSVDPVPLMFQTGYLTIDSFDSRAKRYMLRFPNREVEIGFAKNLLPLYVPDSETAQTPFSLDFFKDDLIHGRPEEFMRRLQTLFKSLPYSSRQENVYQSIVWLLCVLSGEESEMERHSYRGRSDLEVMTVDYVYVFEFKYERSVEEAMSQLHDRDYAGRFDFDSRTVFLIGANFSIDKADCGLGDWKIEVYRKAQD